MIFGFPRIPIRNRTDALLCKPSTMEVKKLLLTILDMKTVIMSILTPILLLPILYKIEGDVSMIAVSTIEQIKWTSCSSGEMENIECNQSCDDRVISGKWAHVTGEIRPLLNSPDVKFFRTVHINAWIRVIAKCTQHQVYNRKMYTSKHND